MNKRYLLLVLFCLIVLAFQVFTVYAWNIDDYGLCKETVDMLPVRMVNEFYVTDTEVNFWFHIVLDEPADIKLKWIKPNGDTYHTTKWDTFEPGNWNSVGTLFIEDSDVTERYLGQEWEAELYVNNELAAFDSWIVLDIEAMAARLLKIEDEYFNLTDSYDELIELSIVQIELYTMLEEDYESLQRDYDSLISEYTQLDVDYNELLIENENIVYENERLQEELDRKQGIPGFPLTSMIIGVIVIFIVISFLNSNTGYRN